MVRKKGKLCVETNLSEYKDYSGFDKGLEMRKDNPFKPGDIIIFLLLYLIPAKCDRKISLLPFLNFVIKELLTILIQNVPFVFATIKQAEEISLIATRETIIMLTFLGLCIRLIQSDDNTCWHCLKQITLQVTHR